MDFNIRAISLATSISFGARRIVSELLGQQVEFRSGITIPITLPDTLEGFRVLTDPERLLTALDGWTRVYSGQSFVWSLDRQHAELRERLKERLHLQDPAEFVVYSFRHTMLTRLGESGADAFTIMKIAGHSDIRVSQRYVHPSPESQERAFERLDALNRSNRGEEAHVPTISATVKKRATGVKAVKYHIINTRARSSAG